ncbi:hypothetical protein ACFWNK_07455 [Streptomyces sp. NPDC058417]|uniref:hypothetical protein n=1 Tax=unclassified Streptomyces TaxID=2593676 RepID=UPI0036502FE0
MRRTARVLSVAALAGAVLAGAPAAAADPAAEISPASATPGGSVTVTVTCDPLGGPAPQTIQAVSEAFEDGSVALALEPGGDELTGPAYRGTARIAPDEELDLPDTGLAPDETDADADPEAGADVGVDDFADADADADAGLPDADDALTGDLTGAGAGAAAAAAGPAEAAWTVDGTCPAPPGGKGATWTVTYDVKRSGGGTGPACVPAPGATCPPVRPCAPGQACPTPPPCPPGHSAACPTPRPTPTCAGGRDTTAHTPASCPPVPPVHQGVRAGTGGSFTDSVPALTVGGLLIAGALAAAVHRLRRRDRTDGA